MEMPVSTPLVGNDGLISTLWRRYLQDVENNLPKFKMGTFTINLSTTGDQAIVGVGFKPSLIEFKFGIDNSANVGWSRTDGTNMQMVSDKRAGVEGVYLVNDSYITYYNDGTNAATSVIKSLDSDGFTITKSKVAAPVGTLAVMYLAWR